MSRCGLDVFENTLQKTHEWLSDLQNVLGWDDRQKAYLALRGVLQALRDRLPVETAVKFGAQLPMLIRGFYYEGWKPAITPIKVKSSEDFVDLVSFRFTNTMLSRESNIEEVVRAVFKVVACYISPGEVYHIAQTLPFPIADLWPSIDNVEEQETMHREMRHSAHSAGKRPPKQ